VKMVRPDPLMEGLGDAPTFYFVHSYHLRPDTPDTCVATCAHGGDLVVAVRRDNIMGVQFHPEKSQDDGLRLLRNFVGLAA
jgi:imidazole glycerol-phosphate synthase subunit HisH